MSVENNQFRNGDRLPDTHSSVDRVYVEYPLVSHAEILRLHKAGEPVPMAGHVVGTVRRNRAD